MQAVVDLRREVVVHGHVANDSNRHTDGRQQGQHRDDQLAAQSMGPAAPLGTPATVGLGSAAQELAGLRT